MKKFYSNKAFKLGIFAGAFVYILIYASNCPLPRDYLCFDCHQTTGFPFASYESGTILHLDRALWIGQIANILAAMLFISTFGLITNFIWSTISTKRNSLK